MIGFTLIDGTFIASPSLITKMGILVPNTLMKTDIPVMAKFSEYESTLNVIPRTRVLANKSFIENIHKLPLDLDDLVGPLEDLTPLIWPDSLPKYIPSHIVKGYGFWHIYRGAILKLKMFKQNLTIHVVEIVINEERPKFTSLDVLHLYNRQVPVIPGSKSIDISELGLTRSMPKIAWVIITASLFPDNTIITYANDDKDLLNCGKRTRYGAYTKSVDGILRLNEPLVISPQRSRDISMHIVQSCIMGQNIYSVLFDLPVDVFVPNDQFDIIKNKGHAHDSVLCRDKGRDFVRTSTTGSFINQWGKVLK
jgi:hypothetical protein